LGEEKVLIVAENKEGSDELKVSKEKAKAADE